MHGQVLLYRFGPGADFEGRLVGALERIESGGTVRVREAVFVRREPATGELVAIDLTGEGAGSLVEPLLDFRLESRTRDAATERALRSDVVRQLSRDLAPGHAIAAVLLEHDWARTLEDAVIRSGGVRVASRSVEATSLEDARITPSG